jgi:hypothetical protein
MNTFEKKVIGLPDTKMQAEIVKLYTEICHRADALYNTFEYFLAGDSEIKLFLDFLAANDPRAFLYSRFIEINGISFPGLSIEKIIELDLVDVNKEDFSELLSQRIELLSLIEKSKEVKFYFPLNKLFHKVEEISDFGISFEYPEHFKTPEFDTAIFNRVRKFTTTEKENEVLEVAERAVSALNDLVDLGFIRNDKQRWTLDLDDFIHAIQFNLNSERPLSINQNLARFKGFIKYFENQRFVTTQSGTPKDILKFEEPITEIQNIKTDI